MKHLLFLGIAFAAFQISHSTAEFCELPPEEGIGPNFDFALYYDAVQDLCYPFIYKGQGGNDNRFDNERDCIRNCSARAEDVYPMDATHACHLKKASGSKCSSQLMRFYYDSVHEKCKKFQWSGCNGNGNRFLTFEICNATCAGIRDDGDGDDENEPDTPLAIIFGVLLAVILVAVLTAVIVFTVKSKKNKAKKKAGGKSRDPKSESPLQEQGMEMS